MLNMRKRERLLILVALFVLSFVIISGGEKSYARVKTENIGQLAVTETPEKGGETSRQDPEEGEKTEGTVAEPGLSDALIGALESTGADRTMLNGWIEEIPLSALRHLPDWDPERQTETGLVAAYIMHENRHLGLKTIWREAAAFVHYGDKFDVPLDLLVAVGNTESHFKPDARSGYGACGIMQVVWRIHSRLMQANGIMSRQELFDPEKGIAAGTLLLGRYLRAYGSTRKALGRYYGGSANVYMSRINRKLKRLERFSAKKLP